MIQKILKSIKSKTLLSKAKNYLKSKRALQKNKKYFHDDEKYLKEMYKYYFGNYPNIENPQTFNEKLLWLKLYWRDDRCYDIVDKYKVRNYVISKGLKGILVPNYGVYNSLEEINFQNLPSEFVIKTTHGGGNDGVYLVTDKTNSKQLKSAKKIIKSSTKRGILDEYKEWVYYKSEPKIIVEKLLKNLVGESLTDYKFYCFHGKAYFVLAVTNRNTLAKFDYFDANWNWLDLRQGGENNKIRPPKPINFDEMKKIAEILSDDFPHVRVDLYNINGKIYFGELTFFDSAGNANFDPNHFDYEFGKHLDIQKVTKKEPNN